MGKEVRFEDVRPFVVDVYADRLREAIIVGRRSVATAAGIDASTRATCLSNLGGSLLVSYGITQDRAERDEAILRSDNPTAKAEDRFYYEVRLKGTGVADVRRHRGSLAGTGKRDAPRA